MGQVEIIDNAEEIRTVVVADKMRKLRYRCMNSALCPNSPRSFSENWLGTLVSARAVVFHRAKREEEKGVNEMSHTKKKRR